MKRDLARSSWVSALLVAAVVLAGCGTRADDRSAGGPAPQAQAPAAAATTPAAADDGSAITGAQA
ncbi:MAG TPA: hypothetical protein VHL53_08490, partial [Acidimicrobiia bacterium]|nr:hypothetical protein [Acidimicrobiia bacterium]